MSQVEAKIQVEPKDELIFNGPFDRVVSSKIKLTNPGTNRYYFKVKTTVPKSYCVKPSCGFIEPSSTVHVEILLQPVSVNQSDKSKHKFMIQFLQVAFNEKDVEKLWKDPASKIEDFKLKCVMKQPEEIIEIDPTTNITFEGPFTSPVTSYIKINNSSANPVCFKIQTTAPKKYSVTPNSGLIEPQESQFISVTLHQFDYNPNEQYKERFLLQYVVTPDVTAYRESVWTDFADKKIDYILKSIYHMPNENNITPVASGTLKASTSDQDKQYRSEIDQLKSKLATYKLNEERLRKITIESGNLSMGHASRDPGFFANNAILLTFIALILGVIAGKFFL